MAPTGWRVPAREELFPVAAEQSCAICGSDEWRYVYLLLHASHWVQALPWTVSWFVVLCGPCHDAFEAGNDAELAVSYDRSDKGAASPDVTEFLKVIRARLSEPPVAREDAQHGVNCP